MLIHIKHIILSLQEVSLVSLSDLIRTQLMVFSVRSTRADLGKGLKQFWLLNLSVMSATYF